MARPPIIEEESADRRLERVAVHPEPGNEVAEFGLDVARTLVREPRSELLTQDGLSDLLASARECRRNYQPPRQPAAAS